MKLLISCEEYFSQVGRSKKKKKIMSESVLPMFSSRSFIVSGLTSRSLIHFDTPVFLPGESQGQRSLAGYSPQGCKESDMTELLILTA